VATDAVFYDVYTKLVDINLSDLGLDVAWYDVDVEEKQGVDRWGRTREYFAMKLFRLPICTKKP
jgi:protein arginine N-methyltransferase 2